MQSNCSFFLCMSCYICAIWLYLLLQKININEYFFLRRIQQDPLLNIERLVCRSIKTFSMSFFNLIFQQLLHLTFLEDITLCTAVNLIRRRKIKSSYKLIFYLTIWRDHFSHCLLLGILLLLLLLLFCCPFFCFSKQRNSIILLILP